MINSEHVILKFKLFWEFSFIYLNRIYFPPYIQKIDINRFFHELFCGREFPPQKMLISLSINYVGGNG